MKPLLLAAALAALPCIAQAATLEYEGGGIYRLRDAWTLQPPRDYSGTGEPGFPGDRGLVAPAPVPAPRVDQGPRRWDDLPARLDAIRRQHGGEPAAPGPAWMR